MKKVALSLAVLFAAALVSCGNKENKEEEAAVDSAAMTETVDSAAMAVDTTAQAAPADSAAAPTETVDTAANK